MLEAIKNAWKNIKKSVARSILKKYVTRENIAKYSAELINNLILSRLSRFDDADVSRVAQRCAQVAILAAEIADAVKDKTITTDEIFVIASKVEALTGSFLSESDIDGLIEKILAKI